MERALKKSLVAWRVSSARLPLIIRGARQVGKTYLVEDFAQENFKNFININFEREPKYKECFTDLDPQRIVANLELLTGLKVKAGESLIFFDEIQNCPAAIESLRYFKEELPALHVIGTGSLLEFALHQTKFSMPVGRVQFLYLQPLSFKEFLWARNKEHLCDYLAGLNTDSEILEAVHQELLNQVRLYLILGGMPAVLSTYLKTESLQEARYMQGSLLEAYRADFSKYGRNHEFNNLETLFSKLPNFVSQQIKYSKLDPDVPSRNLKSAIEKLRMAGVVTPIFATGASGLPLIAHRNERKFKTLFIDVGLMLRASHVDPALLIQNETLFLLQGAMMEQMVGQELLAYQDPHERPELYFWERIEKSAQAEVDYLEVYGTKILPVEVKSKSVGHLKSLRLFMKEKNAPIGIRISEHPLSFDRGVLSVPLYMIFELKRLLNNKLLSQADE